VTLARAWGRTRGRARWLFVLPGLAVPGLVALEGCQLVAGLRDIEEVDAAADATTDSGRDGQVMSDVTLDAPMHDAMSEAEAGVPDGPYGSSELELIDNMEQRTGSIASLGGRDGPWFTYNDMSTTGHQTPKAGGAFTDIAVVPPREIPESLGGGESHYAAETNGYGFTLWGAGMGFNFLSTQAAYDASAFIGFVFWGRIGGTLGEADGGVAGIRLNVPDMNTDPRGDVCNEAGMTCNDFFGKNLTFTTEWQEFEVLYTDLGQLGFGTYEPALDAAHVYGCQFLVTTDLDNNDNGAYFDVWIDDIYFIKTP
jgi:hypothetical protein